MIGFRGSNRFSNKLVVSVFIVSLSVTAGHLGAAVDVRAVDDFKTKAGKCILAPMSCDKGVNCVKTERQFINRVVQVMPVDSSEALRDAFFEQSIENPTQEQILAVAKDLGYDSVLFAGIVDSDRDYDFFWGTDSVSGTSRLVIKTVDGKLLVDGTASTEMAWMSSRKHQLARKQLINILQKADKQAGKN